MALAVSASMATSVFAAEAEPAIKVDGRTVVFREEVAPVIKNDRLYVPVRRVLEQMDATVNWDDATKTVTVNSFDNVTVVKMQIDNPVITRYFYTSVLNADKTEITSDVAPTIIDDRTMLPIRVVAEALDSTVYYDEETKITHITTKQAKRAASRAGIDVSAEDFMIADAYKDNIPNMYIDCEQEDVKKGDIVEVKVKVKDIEKFDEKAKLLHYTLGMKYDKENFKYEGYTCFKNGEEFTPSFGGDNGEFTENSIKIVAVEKPGDSYLPAEDGTIMIVKFKATTDNGGNIALSDGITNIGNDTMMSFELENDVIENVYTCTEFYIDITPVTVK